MPHRLGTRKAPELSSIPRLRITLTLTLSLSLSLSPKLWSLAPYLDPETFKTRHVFHLQLPPPVFTGSMTTLLLGSL